MDIKKSFSKKAKRTKVIIFSLISLMFVTIAASVAVVGISYWGNRNFIETFYSVSSIKTYNKIRIIQISDLHDSTYGKDNEKLIDRITKLNPDIILMTGDCIDADNNSTDGIVNLCSALVEIAPSYYIYGNNEVEKYYDYFLTQEALDAEFGFDDTNRDPDKLLSISDSLTEKLESVGVNVLKNSADTITIGDTVVDIYGVLTSNPSSFWSYAGESFNDFLYTNESHLKITAIHEPWIFNEYTPDYWGDVMLAGHTHGGLIKIPMIGALYTPKGGLLPGRKGEYVYGRYEVQGRPLIVSSGLENKNIFRINNEPEIVIIDINKF